MPDTTKYLTDFRVSHPSLHLLYVKSAVRELRLIDDMIHALHDEAKTTLCNIICVMQAERDRLVAEEAAYADADQILRGIARVRISRPAANAPDDEKPVVEAES